jgi:hypothetical protein
MPLRMCHLRRDVVCPPEGFPKGLSSAGLEPSTQKILGTHGLEMLGVIDASVGLYLSPPLT